MGTRTAKAVLFLSLPWAVFVIGVTLSDGLNVWPMGDIRTWLRFLQDGPGSEAARLFWALDGRNPLSPWWYIAIVRPLSHLTDAVMLLLQMTMGLVVGVCSYLMAKEVSRGRGRRFAFGLGIVVSLFIATRAIDGSYWNFLGALSCSLLSIWAYAIFVRKERQNPYWLVTSLLLYFVALATYFIQIGAVLAVSALAFISGRTLHERFALLIKDALPYFILLIIFVLIWSTTRA